MSSDMAANEIRRHYTPPRGIQHRLIKFESNQILDQKLTRFGFIKGFGQRKNASQLLVTPEREAKNHRERNTDNKYTKQTKIIVQLFNWHDEKLQN